MDNLLFKISKIMANVLKASIVIMWKIMKTSFTWALDNYPKLIELSTGAQHLISNLNQSKIVLFYSIYFIYVFLVQYFQN